MASLGIRDVSVVFASRVAVAVGGLALQSCLAWFLGTSGRGSYAVCVMYTMLLSTLCTFGVDGSAQYFVASRKLSISEGISALVSLEAVGAILGLVGGIALLYLPIEFFNKASHAAFIIAVAAIPAQMLLGSLELTLAAQREFSFAALISATNMLLRLILTVVLVRVVQLGVHGALVANLLTFTLGGLAILTFLRRRHHLHWVAPSWAHLRRMLGYGGRYYFAAFGMIVNFQIGSIMIAFFASRDDVGLFHSAVTLIVQVIMISDVVGSVIHPRIASEPGGRPELAAQSARIVGMICGGIILVFLIVAKPTVGLLLSPEFLPTVPVLWILGPGVVYRAATKVFVHYLKATDRPGVFSVSTIFGALVNLTLLAVLLPVMGLEGAALAMTIGYLCTGTVLMRSFLKHSGMSFAHCWRVRRGDFDLLVRAMGQIQRRALRRDR
ncbi:MAG: polysaccharide biosynthesis C-terminal domain-containing protein [Phycisphaerae bacterium]